jgi:hypothetical protein
MRQSLLAAGFLMGVLLFSEWGGVHPAVAQPRSGPAEVSPKILAFIKPVEVDPGDSELRKKLKERHNAAAKMLEERINDYKKGVRDAGQVYEAARLTAEAKQDLAENAEARIVVLEQVLEVAKLFESSLQQQLDKGFGSKADLERARYARLSVEIELLKAKQKDAPKPD